MPRTTTPALPAGAMSGRAQPVLRIDELVLRPWRPGDEPALVAAFADEAIQTWHARTMDHAEAVQYVSAVNTAWREETGAHWAVTDGSVVLGRMSLRTVDLMEGLAEIGYWVLPQARGRAVAPRALDVVSTWALHDLGLHRLELAHSARNPASCRVAEKAGYRWEGTKRSEALHADGWHDMHLHARIAGEPSSRGDAGTPASRARTVSVDQHASGPAWTAVDDYFTGALLAEDQALVAARTSGARTTMPDAEVSANQGALLALLVQLSGARRVLEFGTLAGYSTSWLARAVGPGGQVVTLELEDRNATIALDNVRRSGVADRVRIVVGPAAESAQQLAEDNTEPFDLVFIDADKPSNPHYLAAALRLTRSGAVIMIDNVVRDGAVLDGDSADPRVQGVREVVAALGADADLDATAVQTVGGKGWDGFIVARRR